LRLGHITAVICVACWLAAGTVWPTTLRIVAGHAPEGLPIYINFVGSFVVCGLIAATYPYFLVTYRVVRVVYPALLGPDGPGPTDGPALRRVARELGVYRVLAAAIPLVAVGLIVALGVNDETRIAVGILAVTGVAGTLMAFVLESRIRADLQALTEVPAGR
jgi:hypothetical protein